MASSYFLSSPPILICQTLNSNSVASSKLRKGGGIIGTEREILGNCNLRQLRKQILRLKRWYFPSLPFPLPLEKPLPRKTGINSWEKQKLQSLWKHSWISSMWVTTALAKLLFCPGEENALLIVLGNPFSWGSVALCGCRRGPDACSCCDVKMTLAACSGLAAEPAWAWAYCYCRHTLGQASTAVGLATDRPVQVGLSYYYYYHNCL